MMYTITEVQPPVAITKGDVLDIALLRQQIVSQNPQVIDMWRSPNESTLPGREMAALKRNIAVLTSLLVQMPLHKWDVVWSRSTSDVLAVSVIPHGKTPIDPIIPVPLLPFHFEFAASIKNIALHCLTWNAKASYLSQQNWHASLQDMIRHTLQASKSMGLSESGRTAMQSILMYLLVEPQEKI